MGHKATKAPRMQIDANQNFTEGVLSWLGIMVAKEMEFRIKTKNRITFPNLPGTPLFC